MTDSYGMEPPRSTGQWKIGLAVALGCFTIIMIFVAIIGGGVFAAFSAMKDSGPVHDAVVMAAENPEVIARLGEPIEAGLMMSGDINFSGDSGSADIAIPISGPEGKATVSLVGKKQDGKWQYTKAIVRFDDSDDGVDLLAVNF